MAAIVPYLVYYALQCFVLCSVHKLRATPSDGVREMLNFQCGVNVHWCVFLCVCMCLGWGVFADLLA